MATNSSLSARDYEKYTPAYQVINNKLPSELELRVDRVFMQYVDSVIKLESDEETERRKRVLHEIKSIFLKFVQKIAKREAKYAEDDEKLVADLFVSGSHRLGVRDVGADIDTVCVAPNFVKREHFFKDLKEDLLSFPDDVKKLNAVEDAFVPVMEFEYQGVAIDLLFARLGDSNQYPTDKNGMLNIMDDSILLGVDPATMTSLNGPRVTNMIAKLVEQSYDRFLIVLRCIRRWAKKRGLYGNKMGYLGGVNCNILVAFICQLFPNACPCILLQRFFGQYQNWKWPEPIQLNNIQKLNVGQLDEGVWSPEKNPNDLMPLITPAYPAMNSSYNVNVNSFHVLQEEFVRGHDVVVNLLKSKDKNPENWGKLFEPSDFFIRYSHYLACHIVGNGDNVQSRSWIGFVESRLRRLTLHPFLERLALMTPIHLYPVSHGESDDCVCYFIGFHIDYARLEESGSKELHIDQVVAQFVDGLWDPDRGHNKGQRIEGLDFYVDHLTWKKLPKKVFDVYGGYEVAKKLRKEMGYGQASNSTVKNNANSKNAINPSSNGGTEKSVSRENDPLSKLPGVTLNASEIIRRDIVEEEATAVPSAPANLFPTIELIKHRIADAHRTSISCNPDFDIPRSDKRPRWNDGTLLPRNYHLPALSWQLMDNK